MKQLDKLRKEYETKCWKDNYHIGGGLADKAHVSRRYEDANSDAGKLRQGLLVAKIKKATGIPTDVINQIIDDHFPLREWHHAGRFKGRMRKVYFLNASEIVKLIANFEQWADEAMAYIEEKKSQSEKTVEIRNAKRAFAMKWATRFQRIPEDDAGELHVIDCREMHGKYGWFEASHYSLPVYVSGWKFRSKKKLNEYLSM